MSQFFNEVSQTTKQVRKAIEADRTDGGVAKYKKRIRKYAVRGKTKMWIPMALPTSVERGEKVCKALKAEGLKITRSEKGAYAHWA